jgi:hypothetical protein
MTGFRYTDYEEMVSSIVQAGYRFITLRQYFSHSFEPSERLVVNRIDVDVKIERLAVLRQIFRRQNIRASIFVRLHAPQYNLLNFGTLRLLRDLVADGHEIGLHTELMDAEGFLGVRGASVLRSEIDMLQTLLGEQIYGTASHGDMTPHNNLHFWQNHYPHDFGLLYEAYDRRLWENCRYVSDSEWVRWKAYSNGALMEGDRRTPHRHILDDAPPVVYLLTHPESWYEYYLYE